jgi:hypothetical protein
MTSEVDDQDDDPWGEADAPLGASHALSPLGFTQLQVAWLWLMPLLIVALHVVWDSIPGKELTPSRDAKGETLLMQSVAGAMALASIYIFRKIHGRPRRWPILIAIFVCSISTSVTAGLVSLSSEILHQFWDFAGSGTRQYERAVLITVSEGEDRPPHRADLVDFEGLGFSLDDADYAKANAALSKPHPVYPCLRVTVQQNGDALRIMHPDWQRPSGSVIDCPANVLTPAGKAALPSAPGT